MKFWKFTQVIILILRWLVLTCRDLAKVFLVTVTKQVGPDAITVGHL